jgi:hypothetical protein
MCNLWHKVNAQYGDSVCMFHLWCFWTNSLTLWRQNPKVNHHIHERPPPVLILSQVNPLHTPQPLSLRSIQIPSSYLCLSLPSGLFPLGFPTKNLYTFLPSLMHATCSAHLIHFYFISLVISDGSTNYEVPHCATFSILLLLRPS